MFIKPNKPHDILSRYLPRGTGLLVEKTMTPIGEPCVSNITTTEFPVKEYIDTIRPPEKLPLVFQTPKERKEFLVGCFAILMGIVFGFLLAWQILGN